MCDFVALKQPVFFMVEELSAIKSLFCWSIRPCHTAAILSRETKKALFYHAKPRSGNHGGEAWRGKTKLFWCPGTIWPPCDKGELTSSNQLIQSFHA